MPKCKARVPVQNAAAKPFSGGPAPSGASALPYSHRQHGHIISRFFSRPGKHLFQNMVGHFFWIGNCTPLNNCFQEQILLAYRQRVQYSIRHHNHKISGRQFSFHRIYFYRIHHPDRQTGGTQMLYLIFLFYKRR